MAFKAIPDLARVVTIVATGGNPLAGAIAANVLQAVLADQDTLLEEIKADTQTLVHGPYNTGRLFLDQALQAHRTKEEKQEFVEKARDEFIKASGQEYELFHKSLAQYGVGNCWTLLASNADARVWYQRAHKSAIDYLREIGRPLVSRLEPGASGRLYRPEAHIAEKVMWNFLIPYQPLYYWDYRQYKKAEKAMRMFMEEVPAVLDLVNSLEQLRIQAPQLELDFGVVRPPKTPQELEVWLKTAFLNDPLTTGRDSLREFTWTVTDARLTSRVKQGRSIRSVVVDFMFTNHSVLPTTLRESATLRLLDSEGREYRPVTAALDGAPPELDMSLQQVPSLQVVRESTEASPELDMSLQQVDAESTKNGRVIFSVAQDASGFRFRLELFTGTPPEEGPGPMRYINLGF